MCWLCWRTSNTNLLSDNFTETIHIFDYIKIVQALNKWQLSSYKSHKAFSASFSLPSIVLFYSFLLFICIEIGFWSRNVIKPWMMAFCSNDALRNQHREKISSSKSPPFFFLHSHSANMILDAPHTNLNSLLLFSFRLITLK